MADTDPTGRTCAPQEYPETAFRLLAGVRDDLLDDLDAGRYADDRREQAERDAAAHGRVLVLLTGGPVAVDKQMRACVCDLAEAIDRLNEYRRVVREHDAMTWLLGRVGARRSACRRLHQRGT